MKSPINRIASSYGGVIESVAFAFESANARLDGLADAIQLDDMKTAEQFAAILVSRLNAIQSKLDNANPPKAARQAHSQFSDGVQMCCVGATQIEVGIRNRDEALIEQGAGEYQRGKDRFNQGTASLE